MTHNWSDFEALILDEVGNHMRKLGPELRGDIASVVGQDLFGDEPVAPVSRNLGKDELHFSKIVCNYREVESCIERLADIPIYLNSFPYRSNRLDKNRYLRYHIEGYFNEVFILRDRLTAYLKRVGRAFRGDRRHTVILTATKPLFQMVTAALTGVSNTRNTNVHQRRFDSSSLSRLDTIQFVSRFDEFRENVEEFYDLEYRETRNEWKSRFKSNNIEILKLLDSIADRTVPVLFNVKKKRLKYPRATAA